MHRRRSCSAALRPHCCNPAAFLGKIPLPLVSNNCHRRRARPPASGLDHQLHFPFGATVFRRQQAAHQHHYDGHEGPVLHPNNFLPFGICPLAWPKARWSPQQLWPARGHSNIITRRHQRLVAKANRATPPKPWTRHQLHRVDEKKRTLDKGQAADNSVSELEDVRLFSLRRI